MEKAMEQNNRNAAIMKQIKPKTVEWMLFVFLLAAFALFLLRFNQVDIVSLVSTQGRTFERAAVTEVLQDNVQEDGIRVGQQKVLLEMKSGIMKGKTVEATSNNGYLLGAACRPGMNVVVIQSISGDISIYTVYSIDREWIILGMVIFFFAVVCVIGGKKGVQACFGLAFTFVCIIWFYIPMIYKGYSPFLAAVLVAAVTTFVNMYLLGGWSVKTACVVIGTVSGVAIAGIFAYLFGKAANISGYNVSNIESLLVLENMRKIRVGELLFSGLLISALGAVMDTGMAIVSATFEIHNQNQGLSRKELFQSGMNVGRDTMGTMVNTLILVFVGSSASILLLNYAYELPYLQIINSNNMVIEIMEGLSGCMGIVVMVPIVSFISAFAVTTAKGPLKEKFLIFSRKSGIQEKTNV